MYLSATDEHSTTTVSLCRPDKMAHQTRESFCSRSQLAPHQSTKRTELLGAPKACPEPGYRERERELRREGGKSLLAYVKGVDPHLIHIDRPTTIRSPEHISGWVNYPPAYVIWVDGCVARTAGRGDVPYDV